MPFIASRIATSPFADQCPGTSGLRKRVHVFQQENYTHNFVQATLATGLPNAGADSTLVVGGDGRFWSKEAVQIICSIAAGSKVRRLIIGQHGILSTPAASNIIRKHAANGGILLTASHNPGGPDADFGIKFNCANGGPAPEAVTQRIHEFSTTIASYNFVHLPEIDTSRLGTSVFTIAHDANEREFILEIIDSVEDYTQLMRSIFNFDLIQTWIQHQANEFTFLFDGMHGVTGPYAERIFVSELGLPATSLMRCSPLQDFGGAHPDPNLTCMLSSRLFYNLCPGIIDASDLVERVRSAMISLGAASDGDGDRNMIVAHDAFVNPSDSVAVIAANSTATIPYFTATGVKGVARSMPTSMALDRVAEANGWTCYEVPTGWKFFGNLMDAGLLSICGEESFGQGSDHIREKDGLWAILAWLNILAFQGTVSISSVLARHFSKYGRNFFTRYDYEGVDGQRAAEMMRTLGERIASGELVGCELLPGVKVSAADDFSYTDPVDNSFTPKQGYRIQLDDGSRGIFRLSGTGSSGATIRLYIEKYANGESGEALLAMNPQSMLHDLVAAMLELSQLQAWTGRDQPTVIT